MKPKILAVKYFDWVLLVALGALLVFSLVKNFLIHDRTLEDLSAEIAKYDRFINERMRSDEVRVEQATDFLGEMRNRFEHMPVISPYRRDPFVIPSDIDLGMVQVVKAGKKKLITIKGARINELLTPTTLAEIKWQYKPDDGDTDIEISGLDGGSALLRWRDDTEKTYRALLNVLVIPDPPTPNPPVDVSFATRAPVRKGPMLREPPMVLVVFFPDNPALSDTKRGPTTGAWIERKLADDPDVEYVRLNQKPVRQIKKREEAAEMWRQFKPEEPAAVKEPAGGQSPAGAWAVPEEATAVPMQGATGTAAEAAPLVVMGSFAFIDATVDEGESYVYRIVTINEVENLPPKACDAPFVSPTPINVPSLVQFSVFSTSPDGSATFNITAPGPDGMPMTQRFTVRPGMPIGSKVRTTVSVAAGAAPGLGGAGALGGGGVANTTTRMVKDVDFSTGCTLVGALPAYKELEYRLQLNTRSNQITYQVRPAPGGQVLYLTPLGVLRWKGKEQTSTTTGPGSGAVPGMMPGPHGIQ